LDASLAQGGFKQEKKRLEAELSGALPSLATNHP
jgi:hypothetical protein